MDATLGVVAVDDLGLRYTLPTGPLVIPQGSTVAVDLRFADMAVDDLLLDTLLLARLELVDLTPTRADSATRNDITMDDLEVW